MLISSFACSLMLVLYQSETQASPITSLTQAPEIQEMIQRREIPMKVSEILKPENHHLQVKMVPPKKKSLMHHISDIINNKPFLAFSTVLSASILANTAVIGACIHEKEKRVMLKKAQKGELPVALSVPVKAPEKSKETSSDEVQIVLKKDKGDEYIDDASQVAGGSAAM